MISWGIAPLISVHSSADGQPSQGRNQLRRRGLQPVQRRPHQRFVFAQATPCPRQFHHHIAAHSLPAPPGADDDCCAPLRRGLNPLRVPSCWPSWQEHRRIQVQREARRRTLHPPQEPAPERTPERLDVTLREAEKEVADGCHGWESAPGPAACAGRDRRGNHSPRAKRCAAGHHGHQAGGEGSGPAGWRCWKSVRRRAGGAALPGRNQSGPGRR